MAEKHRILICGDVEGRFNLLSSKVTSINKKNGPFDLLLCVGDFFGEDNSELEPYKNGIKKFPIRTFLVGPNKEEHVKYYPNLDGCDICYNILYLGRRGLYSADSGLKIAYVSGVEKNDQNSSSNIFLTENDVVSVRNACLKGHPNFRGVDFLLSSQWPMDITRFDPNEPNFKYNGSQLIAWLAAHIKPRYHVTGIESIYYERPPYRNQSKGGNSIEIATRFVGLARVGNPQKHKWLYALNLTPVDRTSLKDLAEKTTDETQSPYHISLLNSNSPSDKGGKSQQFFYDMESHNKRSSGNDRQPKRNKKPEFDQAKCWFCLSSPDVSKHLVISVSNEVYIALAKGGLVDDHFLILPITHYQSLSTVSENIQKEIELNKKAVEQYYSSTGRVPVFFERNYKSSHCQLQAVPIPKNLESHVSTVFKEIAESQHIHLKPLTSSLKETAPPGTTYFYLQLPNGEKLYHKIERNFPLQFGREVLADKELLDLDDRIDWKDCQMSEEEETALAKKIRKKFQPYECDS